MIFMTQKQFERKMDRMMYEREERERTFRRLEELARQIDDLRMQLFELKQKVDPEYRQQTLVCGTEVQCGP